MTIQPMGNPPSPQPGNGGSFQTMFGGDYTDIAASAMQQGGGYNSIKKVNGINVDKYALIQRFKTNRSSADQTQYKKDVTLLKTLGYVSGKSPSRTTVEKGYTNFVTDFYLSGVGELNDYVTQRISTTDDTYNGTRATTTRQLSTPAEATEIITSAFKDYLGAIPPAKTVKSFITQLQNLEKNLSAKTVTTRDAAGNAVVTTTGGVATKADKEGLALTIISKILEKQGIENAGPALNTGLTAIRKMANDYGIVVSDQQVRSYAMQYLKDGKLDFVSDKLKNLAKVTYPGLAQFIDIGLAPIEIASQYRAAKSKILEIPVESINLFDSDVRKAISGQAVETLGDFENRMRQSPLWQYTKNAAEFGANLTNKILSKFGMV